MVNLSDDGARARLAWVSSGGTPGEEIRKLAASFGYRLIAPGEGAADLAVVHCAGKDLTGEALAALIASGRSAAPAAGLLIAVDRRAPIDPGARLRLQGAADCASADPVQIFAAARERLRLHALAAEVEERIRTLTRLGRKTSAPDFGAACAPLSVLIAGRPSPAALSACSAIGRSGARATGVLSAGQAMRALDCGSFNAALFVLTEENDLLLPLARIMRRHRDHRRVPVIIVDEAGRAGSRAARDGWELIHPDDIESDLAGRLSRAARRTELAESMKKFLRSPLSTGPGGVASPRFFAAHARDAFSRAEKDQKFVSLMLVSLFAADDAASAMRETAKTVRRIVRAEDLVARLTPRALGVLLRGASAGEAERIAERVEGVVGGSLRRSPQGVVEIAAAGGQRCAGDALETVLARLVRQSHARRPMRRRIADPIGPHPRA
jgi:PleD family two-component response regulator